MTEDRQEMSRDEKLAKVNAMRSKLVDKTTKEPIMRLMSECDTGVKVFSMRIPSADIAIGVGGIPRGRFTEGFGPERSGKTTIAMQIAASCQEEGGVILYVDSEHALDPGYCRAIGLDVEDPGFLIIQEETADVALTAALRMLDEGVIDLVVIDSLANLTPASVDEKVMEEGVGKALVGTKARLLTQFMESAIGRVHKSGAAMFGIQQMRTVMKPGQMVREDTASPNSVKHNSSVRMKIQRKGDNEGTGKKTDETYRGESQETILKVTKNKVAPPFRQSLFTIEYGKGALYWDDLLDCCVVYGIKNVVPGGKFTIVDDNGEILGKFYRKGAEQFFAENPAAGTLLVDKLSDAVCIHLWDPIRGSKDRRIGPYTAEERAAVGGSVIDGIVFEESAEDGDVDIAL